MKKRAKVHLLPTDKTSNILVNTYINETHSASRFVMSVTKDTLDEIFYYASRGPLNPAAIKSIKLFRMSSIFDTG